MPRIRMNDEQWKALKKQFPLPRGSCEKKDRLFFDAVCWLIQTGLCWRDLPPEYGEWRGFWNRYKRLSRIKCYRVIFTPLRKENVQLESALNPRRYNRYIAVSIIALLIGMTVFIVLK